MNDLELLRKTQADLQAARDAIISKPPSNHLDMATALLELSYRIHEVANVLQWHLESYDLTVKRLGLK
jgi:hypothetical protein